MKALIAAGLLASCLFVGTAQAADYRPYKRAMMVWLDDYGLRWDKAFFASGLSKASIESPPAECFDVRSKMWGEGARIFAQFITACEGELPNGCFSPVLKRILRPYLGIMPSMRMRLARLR